MSVTVAPMRQWDGTAVNVAVRDLDDTGALYQMGDPEVTVVRIVAADGAGDATIISAVPCVIRAVRLVNMGAVASHLKLHNTAGLPVVGVAPVAYSVMAQAGQSNPDQHVSGGGLPMAVGCGATLVTGLPNSSTGGVVAGTAVFHIELHLT